MHWLANIAAPALMVGGWARAWRNLKWRVPSGSGKQGARRENVESGGRSQRKLGVTATKMDIAVMMAELYN